MSEKPEFVRVDPHNELVIKLEFNPGEDMLRAQLTDAPDVIGRILAARTLADTGKRKNLRAIADAYPEEDFWGVRASWVTALSKAGTQAAMEAVLEVADVESDPMVLETVIRAMGQFQDDAVAQKVAQMVEQGVPYRARQAAYEVLGAQRDEAQWERLLEGAKTREFAAFPQAGAIHGLAATRRAEAVSVLIEHSEPESGYDRRVRASAASALGVLAKYVEDRDAERAADHLERLLRDGEALVRDSAASGLIAAKAKDRVAALRAYMQTLSHQDQVVLQRGITRLLKAQDPKVKEVESKLDDLKKEYRTLVDRLESLEAKADASSGDSKSSSSKETSS